LAVLFSYQRCSLRGSEISNRTQIKTLRRQIILMLAWNAFFLAATGWIFIVGIAVLLGRLLKWPAVYLHWAGWCGLAATGLIAILLGIRKRPSHKTIAALLDARLSGGGLIIASEDGSAGQWTPPTSRTLTPSWDGRLPCLCFFASMSVLVLAMFVPLTKSLLPVELPLHIEPITEQLKAQVDLLEDIEFIEKKQAEEWTTLIRALKQESSGSDPAATWEALDQLADRIQDAAAVKTDALRMEVQKNEARAAALRAALKAASENPEQATAAMKELSALLQQAAAENPNLKALLDSLPQFGMQPGASATLTPEEAKLLAERLSQMTAEDLERMQKLLKEGLCESGQCQGAGDTESLKQFLAENPGCTNLAVCAGMPAPGEWGISRGPGTAPISWLNDSSEEGVSFKEEMLAATRMNSLNSTKVGESMGAPEVNAEAAGSSGGALDTQQADDSAATLHRVLPQHRQAVNRYFKRNEGK
jgi:hypothetical protein